MEKKCKVTYDDIEMWSDVTSNNEKFIKAKEMCEKHMTTTFKCKRINREIIEKFQKKYIVIWKDDDTFEIELNDT